MSTRIAATDDRCIVHFVLDEKFIDMAYRQFEEVAVGRNQFVMLAAAKTMRHVKATPIKYLDIRGAKELLNSPNCRAVVFHSLNEIFLPLLRAIPKGKPVFWLGWGYDYYDRLLAKAYPDGLFLPKTRLLVSPFQVRKLVPYIKETTKAVIKRALGRTIRLTPEMMNRVDYFCPVLDIEYAMARQLNPGFKPLYLCWNYGTLEDDWSNEVQAKIELGTDVLVGNSATPENNHLEVFDLLRNHADIKGRRIVVPLNYGEEDYRNKIISIGREYFGEQFVPLVEFIPKEQYVDLLDSCGFVFMNHLRQQAVGNILIMMMKGAKIFMHPRSPAYQWFIDRGAAIRSIEDQALDDSRTWESIDEVDRQRNIKIIKEHWGREPQQKKTRNLIEAALGRELPV